MKNKKIKKLSKILAEEIRKFDQPTLPDGLKFGEHWCEYNSEVSEKLKKMVLNLTIYKNNISIDVGDNKIFISINDITNVKKLSSKQINTSTKSPYSEENYVEIFLYKGLGFGINYGYKLKTNYKDVDIFNELKPIILQSLKEINADNFNEIWTELMRKSGVLRDSNLDDVLNG